VNEARIGNGAALVGGRLGHVGVNGKLLSLYQFNLTVVGNFAGADFRTFGIKNDGVDFAGILHNRINGLNARALFLMIAVREVETHNVHARIKKILKDFTRLGLGSDSTYHLSFLHTCSLRNKLIV